MKLNKRRKAALAGMLAGVLFAVLGITLTAGPAQASTTRSFLVTLYGWPDNSPPGSDIAYPKNDGAKTLHNAAGGVGTYANPITFATDKSELPVGTIVYYSYLHRYFIMEDDCVECDQDWTGKGPDGGPHMYHIDLWVGGQGGNSSAIINCEDALTQESASVTINPPGNEPVDTTPLFNSSGNKCYNPSSFKGGSPSPAPKPSPSAHHTPAPRHTPSPSHSATGHSGPSTPPTRVVAPPSGPASTGSYSATAGPGCANSQAASFIGVGFMGNGTGWNMIDGNDGTGSGCSNRFLSMPMTGSATKDGTNRGLWVFSTWPVTSGKCTLRVYIPRPPKAADAFDVDGTSAAYGVFSGTSVEGAALIGQFTINQTAHRGGSVLEGTFKVTQPLLVVRLYDRGVNSGTSQNSMYGVAAIQANCS